MSYRNQSLDDTVFMNVLIKKKWKKKVPHIVITKTVKLKIEDKWTVKKPPG